MNKDDEKIINKIRDTLLELKKRYQYEAKYSSLEVLWTKGLIDGIVSVQMYNAVKKYYGEMWTYVEKTPREFY